METLFDGSIVFYIYLEGQILMGEYLTPLIRCSVI